MKKVTALNKNFYRNNPMEEINIANLFYMTYLMFSDPDEPDLFDEPLFPLDDWDAQDFTEPEIDINIDEISTPEELIQCMRKEPGMSVQEMIFNKALSMQDDFMPLAIERYQSNRQDVFLQLCALIFAEADIKYAQQLYEVYHNIKNPYGQALACVVFGIKGMRETIPLLLDEYYRLKKDYYDEGYEQGPLFALHMFR